ncbi:MAG TPA: alpha/beta hydrolase [Pyrinomonadaceae bacterium]|nr:alpha/beta hydrolase [Pyrinomonadaceae bacterium]
MKIAICTTLAILTFLVLDSTSSFARKANSTLDSERPAIFAGRALADTKFHGVYQIDAAHQLVIANCDHSFRGQEPNLLCFLYPPTGRIGVLRRTTETSFTYGASGPAGGKSNFLGEINFLLTTDGSVIGMHWREGAAFPVFAKATNSIRFEEVTFTNRRVKLAGRLTLPITPGPHPAVVMIQGSGAGGRDYAYYGLLATHLARQGVAVLTYDKRGYGSSLGPSWSNAGIEELADDARAAVNYLKRRPDTIANRIGLYGHSQGGFIAPLVPARGTDVAFVCLLAPPATNTWDQELNEAENDMRSRGFSEADVADALDSMRLMFRVAATGREWEALSRAVQKARSAKWWGVVELSSSERDLARWRQTAYDPRAALEKLRTPVLAMFGELDGVVPPKQNLPLWERYLRAAGNKDFTLRTVRAANHGLLQVKDGGAGHIPDNYSEENPTQLASGVLQDITQWIASRSGLRVSPSDLKATAGQETAAPVSLLDQEKLIGTYAIGAKETAVVYKFGDFLMLQDFNTGRTGGLFPAPDKPNVYNLVAHGPRTSPVKVAFEQTAEGSRIILREPDRPERSGSQIELKQEEVTFRNGDTTLAGTLITPASKGPHPAIVFVHGGGAATRRGFLTWAMLFARHGIAALAYDKRGTGKSTGDFRTSRYEDLAGDVLAGVRLLKSRADIRLKDIGLLGTSQGPWVMGIAATSEKDLAFLVTSSGGPITPALQETYRRLWLVRDAGHSAEEIKQAEEVLGKYFPYLRSNGKEGAIEVSRLWQAHKDKPWFKLLDLPASDPTVGEWPAARRSFAAELFFDPVVHYRQLRLPILALLGEADKVVPAQETIAVFKRTLPEMGKGQLTIEVFPGANHDFTLPPAPGDIPRTAPGYFDKMVSWVKQQVKVVANQP